MSCPSTTTVPDLGFSKPSMQRRSVVLPVPLEPSRHKISPSSRVNDTPWSTSRLRGR